VFLAFYYIEIFLIIICISCFLYCFFSIRKQKPISPIIVSLARIIINIFLTVLFLPSVDTFIILLNCVAGPTSTATNTVLVLD